MILSIKDRIAIQFIIPKQGRIIEMTTASTIMDLVKFTPQEITDFELKDTLNGGATWNSLKERNIKIELTPEQAELLRKAIAKFDETGEITIDMLPVIKKIQSP